MEKMKRAAAIRAYFGAPGYPPVTSKELMGFRADMAGFREMADGAAKQLGVEIEPDTKATE